MHVCSYGRGPNPQPFRQKFGQPAACRRPNSESALAHASANSIGPREIFWLQDPKAVGGGRPSAVLMLASSPTRGSHCAGLRRPPLPNFKDRSLELVSPGIAQQKIKQGVGRPAEFLPPRQRFEGVFSWLRLLHRKIYLFFARRCPQNRKVAPQATFLAPQAKLFGPERWGARKSRFFWHPNRELFK